MSQKPDNARTIERETLNVRELKVAVEECVDIIQDGVERLERAYKLLDEGLTNVVPTIETRMSDLEQKVRHHEALVERFAKTMVSTTTVMKDLHSVMTAPGLTQEMKRMEEFLALGERIKAAYDSGLFEALLAASTALEVKSK